MRVSIRDFKAHLSRYLAEARAGVPIDLTAHRKVVARVVGVPPVESEGVARLVASGAAQWSGGKPKGAAIHLAETARRVSDLVLDDRG